MNTRLAGIEFICMFKNEFFIFLGNVVYNCSQKYCHPMDEIIAFQISYLLKLLLCGLYCKLCLYCKLFVLIKDIWGDILRKKIWLYLQLLQLQGTQRALLILKCSISHFRYFQVTKILQRQKGGNFFQTV